jgi:hypothetical protein
LTNCDWVNTKVAAQFPLVAFGKLRVQHSPKTGENALQSLVFGFADGRVLSQRFHFAPFDAVPITRWAEGEMQIYLPGFAVVNRVK